MARDFPTTQDFLLHHLRRIIEGVACFKDDEGKEQWWFGFGDDTVVSYPDPSSLSETRIDTAKLFMFLAALGIEAKDHMGVPKSFRQLRSALVELSENPLVANELLDKLVPADADDETLQKAYALEMLRRLDDMVERGRKAVQESHLLETVPESVDKYIKEAAACFRYGFDLACITLCRTALEDALKDRISEKIGPKFTKMLDEKRGIVDADLSVLIERATGQAKVLNPVLKTEAHNIRRWGNDCVHGGTAAKDVKETALKALVDIRLIFSDMYQNGS